MSNEEIIRLGKLLNLASSTPSHESALALQRASELVKGDFVQAFSLALSKKVQLSTFQDGWDAAMKVRASQVSFDCMTVDELFEVCKTMTFSKPQEEWLDRLSYHQGKYGTLSDKQIETLKNIAKNGKRNKGAKQ